MTDQPGWIRDGADPQWWTNERGDAVRGPRSYRSGGWWFLPANAPDRTDQDIGPFRTMRDAMAAATPPWVHVTGVKLA